MVKLESGTSILLVRELQRAEMVRRVCVPSLFPSRESMETFHKCSEHACYLQRLKWSPGA